MSESNPLKGLTEAEVVSIKQNLALVRELAVLEVKLIDPNPGKQPRAVALNRGEVVRMALEVLQLEDLIRKQPLTVEPAATPNQGFRRDR